MCSLETKSNSAPADPSAPAGTRLHIPEWLLATLLALTTVALYWPATRCNFINYDDPAYVMANPEVQAGLSWAGVKWAFLNPVASNWDPLTVLSHMAACQLFGLNPWGHHLTNVLFHALNAALVFLLLYRLTAAKWRSTMVAVLFAVHPLHVESVAWVAERKDVLSTFFFLLTLLAYARYVKKSTAPGPQSKVFYGLALLGFALGLMSKPMLVTLPFVLLLLDWWPLKRFTNYKLRNTIFPLTREKLPFFGLAAAASLVTFMVQRHGGAVKLVQSLPLGARAGNALISYCRYLGKLFWPVDLAVFYPHPGYWPLEQVLLAGGLLLGITGLLFEMRRQYPFMLMGWLWYCGTLVPVIGLVQVGKQSMADRHSYIPSIGVLILVIWGACVLTRRWRYLVVALSAAGCAAIVLCVGLTRQQVGYWEDSETLFRHALAVTENNFLAHNSLANTLLQKGRVDEAIIHFQKALQIKPDDAGAHIDLGNALLEKGDVAEAIAHYQTALQIEPGFVEIHDNLGCALLQKGGVDEAMVQFQKVLHSKPNDAGALYNLGCALLQKGSVAEAIAYYQKALQINPNYAQAHYNLAKALLQKGSVNEAIAHFQKTVQINPDSPEVLNNLAWLLATCPDAHLRDGAQAVKYAGRACELTHDKVATLVGTLAAGYAEAGQFDQAVAAAEKACALASAAGEPDLLKKNQELLALYRAHRPYHETAEKFMSAPP
jgi:protein O-mannosyl-transferase